MGRRGNELLIGSTNGKELACQCRRHKRRRFSPWVGKIPWRRAWQPTPVFLLENPMDRGAGQATAHGVTRVSTTDVTEQQQLWHFFQVWFFQGHFPLHSRILLLPPDPPMLPAVSLGPPFCLERILFSDRGIFSPLSSYSSRPVRPM